MSTESPPQDETRGTDVAETRDVQALQEALGPDLEITRRLGRGSMASVYLAREPALGRLVAVKVLQPGKARDETARRRFEREAKAAASLTHPNVVQVFRFGRLPDETPYLVMRFVKGRTMEERIKAEGRLSTDLAKQVLIDVASALADAHSQGIVHRDVRPANVLWDEDRDAALLTDFGIAALLETGGEEATRLTATGQMVGDPRYLSPEQLLDQDLTELVDIYALGILGYELYTTEGPYEVKTNTQWITAHLKGEPRELQAMRPGTDPVVAGLLMRCLNREPKHRPSVADFVRALQADPNSGGSGSNASNDAHGQADLQELIKRRVPQIVLIALVAGSGLLGLMSQFVEMGVMPQVSYRLTLPFVACGIVAATVIAWFHGERGKQQASFFEWILLGMIAVIWVVISVMILVGA
jgi:serine/threonine protein kinase